MTSPDELVEGGARALVLSPHLDDAVFSCGSLLRDLAAPRTAPQVVVTVFTEPFRAGLRGTVAVRRSLREHGDLTPQELYALRRAEDIQVVTTLGAVPLHLGLVDAPYRRRTSRVLRAAGRLLPEVAAVYPTHRWDIALGRVSRADAPLATQLAERVAALVHEHHVDAVLAPAGIGSHVDHLIVREAALAAAASGGHPVLLYADYPYVLQHPVLPPGAGWHQHDRAVGPDKAALLTGYGTQSGLFGGRPPEVVQETYFTPVDAAPRRDFAPPGHSSPCGSL